MAYSPGQIALVSGQYTVIAPSGRSAGREVTVTKGEPFPPAPSSGYTYVIADPTKHKR
ncbi:MAG: YjzC family protein [Stenomitos rutilans HA7619-LM2]|jgi:hypothetical protein|nr:YjzC family protein [Stenomitos rutilans HA7619-LM2]